MAWSAGYKRKINCASKKAGKRTRARKLSASAARLDANGDGRITGADFKFKPKPKPKSKSKSK